MKKNHLLLLFISILLFSTFPEKISAEKNVRKWQDESIYYLMIDRFNDGDSKNNTDVNVNDPLAFNGGDFQGIIDKLDYIKDMGFTTISLTPVFANADRGYHGLWIQNFYKTDKHFGSIQTFQKLVQEAHKRNMKVMIDFIANNVAPTHPWVRDPGKQSWFHTRKTVQMNSSNQQIIQNSWINGLPDLNQEKPQVEKYLIDTATWWIKKTDIDGYHLLGVSYVPAPFWTDFSRKVKKVKKNFYLLGEIQSNDPAILKQYKKTGIDGFDNDMLNQDLRKDFGSTDKPLSGLFADWEKTNQNVIQPYEMGNYLDSPNSTRFTKDIVANKQFPGSRWKMALTYLYTSPGIPIVYYGSEIALNGGIAPDNHRQMNFRTDKELINYITQLGQLRKELTPLTRGTMEKLYEKKGMLVFKRVYHHETVVIAINNTRTSQEVTLPSSQLKDGRELRGLLNGDLSQSRDKQYKLILDRDHAEIYLLANKSGINFPLIGAIAVVCITFFSFLYFILKRRKGSLQ